MTTSFRIPEEIKKYVLFGDSKTSFDSADHLKEDLKKSFNGNAEKVTLKAGVQLWRFCSSVSRYYYSDCWIDDVTMKEIMTSFRAAGIFDMNYKKEVIRDSLAILHSWNKLDYRVKIELKEDVVAYIGTIGSQKVFVPAKAKLFAGKGATMEKMTERRIGGHTQYIIPRLKGMAHDKKENKYAKVLHFCPI